MNHFFYYLASFVLALFFISFGVICFFLPGSANGLEKLIQFILQNSWLPYLIAVLSITVGIAILISIKLGIKKQYYNIKAGNRSTILDEKIFEQYLDAYWRELFPKNQIPSRATIKKNKLRISADLPYIPLTEQKPLLIQIENDLNEILNKYLGYHQEYVISVNFQAENN